jgi:glucose-1-phosphate thymidylyltransferase
MKGIVLAGGTGSRLWPMTQSVSKQLIPIYDKPMIYYPISTLMLAGIQEILIITTPRDQSQFVALLGDGSDFGVHFSYAIQAEPKGLAQAFTIAEGFLGGDSCILILGDNIFHGSRLGRELSRINFETGAEIFVFEVPNPQHFGVLEIDDTGAIKTIQEKPLETNSNLAITGLYFFDNSVVEISKTIRPSARGELEITSVLERYLNNGQLKYNKLPRGSVWLDTGTPQAMMEAGEYVRILEARTGLKIACLEEIAFENGWISDQDLLKKYESKSENPYVMYLKGLI